MNWQGLDNTVFFCGDGINDLSALSAADAGYAVGATEASIVASLFTSLSSVAGKFTGLMLLITHLSMLLKPDRSKIAQLPHHRLSACLSRLVSACQQQASLLFAVGSKLSLVGRAELNKLCLPSLPPSKCPGAGLGESDGPECVTTHCQG